MTTIFAALVLLLSFAGILIWLFSLAKPGRRAELAGAADRLNMSFEPWRMLSTGIRQAGFQILSTGDPRYVPNYIENETVLLFDFTRLTGRAPTVQTLIIMPCPVGTDARLMVSPLARENTHCFDKGRPINRLEQEDLPDALAGHAIYGLPVHKIRPLLTENVQKWLLAHPHLHMEWAAGMLLVCQPGYQIAGDELESVIDDVRSLANALASH